MDLEDQGTIKRIAENEDPARVVVILGQPDADSADLFAQTVTSGDPTWAGPLAGVALGLPVYHILEPEIKAQIDPAIYQEQVGAMEYALETDQITGAVRRARAAAADGGSGM